MKRNIGRELLEGIEAIKNGEGKRVTVNLPSDSRIQGTPYLIIDV